LTVPGDRGTYGIRSAGVRVRRHFRFVARFAAGWLALALLSGALSFTAMSSAVADEPSERAHPSAESPLPSLENASLPLVAISHESRSAGVARTPTHRDVLAERLATASLAEPTTPLRAPTLGIVVPSCHPLLRWCVAHATATSPA
jgi:hypothetical protein